MCYPHIFSCDNERKKKEQEKKVKKKIKNIYIYKVKFMLTLCNLYI